MLVTKHGFIGGTKTTPERVKVSPFMNHENNPKSGGHSSQNCQHQVDKFHAFNVPGSKYYSIAAIEFNNDHPRAAQLQKEPEYQ